MTTPASDHPFGPLVAHRARELVQAYLDDCGGADAGFDVGEQEERLIAAIAAILDGSLGELARISEVLTGQPGTIGAGWASYVRSAIATAEHRRAVDAGLALPDLGPSGVAAFHSWLAEIGVLRDDHSLDPDQVLRELWDYRQIIGEVSKAYDHVTGGHLSKPNTEAMHVITAVERHIEEAIAEETKDLREERDAALARCEQLEDQPVATVPPKPRRRWEVDIHVSADSIVDLGYALREIALDIADRPRAGGLNMVSGGVNSGWRVEGLEIPGQSTEDYQRELRAYLESTPRPGPKPPPMPKWDKPHG